MVNNKLITKISLIQSFLKKKPRDTHFPSLPKLTTTRNDKNSIAVLRFSVIIKT